MMMNLNAQNAAKHYRAVRNQGLVIDASPTRLVQIMYEHILSQLTTAEGCMGRIKGNLPLNDVKAKCAGIGKAVRLINHLDATLDMERGAEIAQNLRNLYRYMLDRLTVANVTNDAAIVSEVSQLVLKIKSGWDQIVTDK
jgi:flagellar protein FliS